MAQLQFWFDFASTYSYLSAMRVEKLAGDAGVTVGWRPFLLGPIFQAQGWTDSPFNIYEAKGRYMWHDMARLCAARGLPFQRPPNFPQRSILAARTALLALRDPNGARFCRAVFRAQFGEGRAIDNADTLAELLKASGLPADLVAHAGDDANKQALKTQVQRAVDLGIFGAPSFVVNEELFWGDDRLEVALAACGSTVV